MQRVAKFEKVSFSQFYSDVIDCFGKERFSDDEIVNAYSSLSLPKRATKGSAGYDFHIPFDIKLPQGSTIKIPTGIRCSMEENWVLKIYPRSGLGFKHRVQLDNTVGIIDSDYYKAKNEGHIMIKLSNDAYQDGKNHNITFQAGDSVAQGIFLEYGITTDDDADELRTGGFGSTGA